MSATKWRNTTALTLCACLWMGVLAPARADEHAPIAWAANTPVFGDLGVSLHSEPSVALAGANTLVAWTDSRNTMTDIYANVSSGNVPIQNNSKVSGGTLSDTNYDSMMQPYNDSHSSAYLEPSGRAFVAYSSKSDIVLARRETNGAWITRTQLSTSNLGWYADARHPALAAVGNDIVLVWQDFRAREWDIYSTRCNKDTLVCQANVKVSNDSTGEAQLSPALAASGNTLVAVWEDHREGGASFPHVYTSVSSDSGATWSANAKVNTGVNLATNPAIAAEPSGAFWAAWEQHANDETAPADIYAAKWASGVWQTPQRMDAAAANVRSKNPQIAVDGSNRAFLVWEDYRNGTANPDIYGTFWNGSAWQEFVVSNHSTMQTQPNIAANGTDLRVVWQDTREGKPDVYTARWNGSGWADEARANDDAMRLSSHINPAVVPLGNGDLYLVWMDNRSYEMSLWLGKYVQATNTWSVLSELPVHGEGYYGIMNFAPAVALDNLGRLHVAWSQNKADVGVQVFHSFWDGSAWADVLQVSDVTTSANWRPRGNLVMTSNAGRVALVWTSIDYGAGWPGQASIYTSWFDGSAWKPQTLVNPTAIEGEPYPTLAVNGAGDLFVAWSQWAWVSAGGGRALRSDIKTAKQAASGGAYAQVKTVNIPSTQNWCQHNHPKLKIATTALHLIWNGCNVSPSGIRLFYSKSADGGNTWAAQTALGDMNDYDDASALAVGVSDVSAMYASNAGGMRKFFAAQFSNGTWQKNIGVSDGPTDWQRDDGNVALVFDAGSNRYLSVFVDRRNRNLPQLYMSTQLSNFVPTRKVFVPAVRR